MQFIALPAIILCIIVALLLYRWATKATDELLANTQTVTLVEDEIIEMIVILADWEEMNELRLLNNKSRTDVDSGHYDEAYATALAKTLESVKAFQEKF